jgi:hypothetical protein
MFSSVADSDAILSMLVYTLAHWYTLDLCDPPNFKGDDFARIRALGILAEDFDLSLYSTVLSYHVAATFDMTLSERPENGEVAVEKRFLETLLPLDPNLTVSMPITSTNATA